jgi:hypothetical protein
MRQSLIAFSFLSAIVLTWPAESKAQSKNVSKIFSALTKQDEDRLNKQRQVVLLALKEKLGVSVLKKDQSDIQLIQKILDEKLFNSSQTYELQSLGVVFGDVLAKELGLHWEMITDEYGNDPTLRYEKSAYNFNALTMISKRVEGGEKVDVHRLFELTRDHLAELKEKLKK